MLDEHVRVLRELRSLGAVQVSVSDGCVSAAWAGPPEVAPSDEKPVRSYPLHDEERAELARLRERYQMDEELGVD